MILSKVFTSNFFQKILLQLVRVLFTAFGTCLSTSTGFPVVSIFWAFEAHQGRWDILFNSLKTIADLHLRRSTWLIKCQEVSVCLDSFFAFSNGDSSYVCNSLFSPGWRCILFCSRWQLPTTDNCLGIVESLTRVGSAFRRMIGFYFFMFSACLRLSTSRSKLSFLVFLTVFAVALVEITFSMRKGKNLARQTSSKYSMTMNLGKSAASFSKSDSDRFRLDVFYLKDAIYAVYFSLALHFTTHHGVQLVLVINQGGNLFTLDETGIRDQYTRAEGRFPSCC